MPFRSRHKCELERVSESCLPGLPPNAPFYKEWFRNFKKLTILSEKLFMTNQVFRSHFAILAEKKRHATSKYSNIIHPFSYFATLRRTVICTLWKICIIIDPLEVCFQGEDVAYVRIARVQLITDFLLFINIFIEFFVGVFVNLTKEIILEKEYIVRNYLRTYFVFDLLGCLPYHILASSFLEINKNSDRIIFINVIKFCRIVRLKGAMEHTKEVLQSFRCSQTTVQLSGLALATFLILHWWTCIMYAVPLIYYTIGNVPKSSWIARAQILPNSSHYSAPTAYADSFLVISCHLYGAMEGPYHITESVEKFTGFLIIVTGLYYCNFFMATILQTFGSMNMNEAKYDELLYQLKEYCLAKKLPAPLRKRLVKYYEYKFQHRFFKESAIMATLSEHLRYEVTLHCCKNIIEKVTLFQGLPKSLIGGLISTFNYELYMENEVIVKYTESPLRLYFISSGTVCVMLPSGQEILHHEDGECFGSVNYEDFVSVTIIALETTEVFYLVREDLKYCAYFGREIMDRIQAYRKQITTLYKASAQIFARSDQKSVLSELRKGRILDRYTKRN